MTKMLLWVVPFTFLAACGDDTAGSPNREPIAPPEARVAAASPPVPEAEIPRPVDQANAWLDSGVQFTSETPTPFNMERFVLARSVESREPVEPGSAFFVNSGRIYAFFELANLLEGEIVLQVSWEPVNGSRARGPTTLRVPARAQRYRTWAYTSAPREAGEWACVVRTEDGQEVARQLYSVKQIPE